MRAGREGVVEVVVAMFRIVVVFCAAVASRVGAVWVVVRIGL